MKRSEIQKMLEEYDHDGLERDGATRVFSWLLKEHEIPHIVMGGRLEFDGDVVQPHFWIELECGGIVDLKARMWLKREEVPHGIFDLTDYPKALYVGGEVEGFIVSKTMFNILTRASMPTMICLPESRS